jgi:hypothetical protein
VVVSYVSIFLISIRLFIHNCLIAIIIVIYWNLFSMIKWNSRTGYFLNVTYKLIPATLIPLPDSTRINFYWSYFLIKLFLILIFFKDLFIINLFLNILNFNFDNIYNVYLFIYAYTVH